MFCSEGSLIQWLKQAAALWTDLLTPGKAYRVASPRPGRYASSNPCSLLSSWSPLLPLPGVGGQDPFRDSPGKESPMGPVPPTPAVSLTEPPHLSNQGGGQPSDPQRPCGPVNSLSPLSSVRGGELGGRASPATSACTKTGPGLTRLSRCPSLPKCQLLHTLCPQLWIWTVNSRETGKGSLNLRIKGTQDTPPASLCA